MEATRRYRVGAVVALALVALVATACSSSSKTSTSSKPSKSPWVIGSVSAVTGPLASSLGGTNETIEAWAKWTDAHGGIDGHQVKVIAMDGGLNPSTTLADVKQLVQQDHIIAMVGEQSDFGFTFATYMEEHHIPVIGTTLADSEVWTNPDFFPEGTTLPSLFYGTVLAAKKAGGTKVAFLYCSEAAECTPTPVAQAGKALGLPLVYSAQISASAPNYTAPCLAAKAAGANVLGIGDASSIDLRVAASCLSQGYHPIEMASDGAPSETWATSPAMQGAVIAQNDTAFSNTSLPAMKTFEEALRKYAPGLLDSNLYGEDVVFEWASGQLFKAAAEAAHLGSNPTPQEVTKGLYDLKGDTLGGIAPPLTFSPGQGHQIKCFFIQGINHDTFTMPYGNKTFCQP